MSRSLVNGVSILLVAAGLRATAARAEEHAGHGVPADTTAHAGMHHDMAGMDMSDMPDEHMHMSGMYGTYAMTREASGTSWQPEAAEHAGVHVMRGAWSLMLHGMSDVIRSGAGGPRGESATYGANMLMGMAQRSSGAATLGLRGMLSAEPTTIGEHGYPLLLQTGETADGRTALVDRQHPHDLFMELAATFSVARGDRSLFVYAGLPGEPALGPPAFMHRFSGQNTPQAPITHHWLDSTHITYGVLTAGAVVDRVKLEASVFRGREPDQDRWNIEVPARLDSHAFRLSVNPSSAWALQASHGRIASPEQLEPDVDQDRTTVSTIHDGRWSGGHWELLAAFGRNRNRPGRTLDAYTVEAAASLGETRTVFVRAERVEKDELFREPDPRAGNPYEVGELSAGYRHDLWHAEHAALAVGAMGTVSLVERAIHDAYGDHPVTGVIWLNARLR